ncbi:MAG: calcium/sodium antiporter [Candidatus Thermoplasmatota archaeon]|nr:calcium/sodium antiporter [Candidatus Thermoplasmatota archaeon]
MASDMGVILDLALLVGGILLIIKGADLFIDSSVAAAKHLGVSPHVIGITLVAFATSLPELAVSSIASSQGAGGIAVGNVMGSNVANITLALGLTALAFPLISSRHGRMDSLIMVGCTFIFWLFMFQGGVIYNWEGLIFIALYIVFLAYILKRPAEEDEVDELAEADLEFWEGKSTGLVLVASIFLGCVVVFGAHLLVLGASDLAVKAGISELIIGSTIVAVGTSLPEISASVAAGLKKQHSIAIGNVVGSNIMNILVVLGAAAMISPSGGISPLGSAAANPQLLHNLLWIGMPFLMLVSLAMLPIAWTKNIGRKIALPLIGLYVIFIFLLLTYLT